MSRSKISLSDKQRIISAQNEGEDYEEVARVLGIKRGTAWSIIRRFQTSGCVEKPRGGARRSKVDGEMADTCVRIVEENPEFTLQQIKHELELNHPTKPHVCVSTISKMLHGELISMKKLETSEASRNADSVKEGRREYAMWLNFLQGQLDVHEIVFVDESGFNLWLARTRGRARVGQRAMRTVGNRRGPNFTCLMAVSNLRGVIHTDLRQGGTTAVIFNEFLAAVSAGTGDGQATIVLDNAPCHRRSSSVAINPNHSLRFLPPYSPFLNIMENAWSCWKAALKRQLADIRVQLLQLPFPEQLSTLTQLAQQNIDVITADKCAAWYRKTTTYIPRCLNRADIIQDHA